MLMRSPLGMERPPARVHKAADAKTGCCSRFLTLLHTRCILSTGLLTVPTHASLTTSEEHASISDSTVACRFT